MPESLKKLTKCCDCGKLLDSGTVAICWHSQTAVMCEEHGYRFGTPWYEDWRSRCLAKGGYVSK